MLEAAAENGALQLVHMPLRIDYLSTRDAWELFEVRYHCSCSAEFADHLPECHASIRKHACYCC